MKSLWYKKLDSITETVLKQNKLQKIEKREHMKCLIIQSPV